MVNVHTRRCYINGESETADQIRARVSVDVLFFQNIDGNLQPTLRADIIPTAAADGRVRRTLPGLQARACSLLAYLRMDLHACQLARPLQTGVIVTDSGDIVTRYYLEVPELARRRDDIPVLCAWRGVVAHVEAAPVCMSGCDFATPETTSIVFVADSQPQDGDDCYSHCMSPQ